MQIHEGLFAHMVLQRTAAGVSHATFAGTCRAAGAVEARVASRGRVLRGWNWRRVGRADGRRFRGLLDGLAAGGPYDLALRIRSRNGIAAELAVTDVLVGDVWVLAGQSNMEGIAWLKDRLPPVKQVRAFYMTDEWGVAEDPLHTLWCAVDPVHGGAPASPRIQRARHAGVGPGLSFAQALYKASGVPQGVLACAHGGTSMRQWDPSKKRLGGRSLYGAMCRRVRKNGGRVAGVFWYQGCSDTSPADVAVYTPRMVKLVRAMRRDFCAPRLPVVAVQISRVCRIGDGSGWNSIRDQQRRLPARIPHLAVVPAIDLPLDDNIHLSGPGQNRLGMRAAQAMQVLREGRKAGAPPIELRDIQVRPNPVTRLADIVVRFRNVVGGLTAAGRPAGLTLEGSELCPCRIDLTGDSAVLRVTAGVDQITGGICYGAGLDPYCNITDRAGRSLPAFGPIPVRVTKPRAVTPFITCLRTSAILPGVSIRKWRYPKRVEMKTRLFAGSFCDRHLELGTAGEALVYYAFDFRCPVPMKLNLLLGYDGPAKVWLDQREIFCDPKGTNPALQEKATIPFSVAAGQHAILVALGSHGAAWGVYLRLERRDVSLRALRRNPTGVVLPEILG